MKILIVDDTEENLYLLESLLTGRGYGVVSAGNGVEALKVLKDGSVDLIISDILMPKMDGFQLCRECKTDDKLRGIPFVFHTATYTDPKDEDFAMSLGADRFIVKPLDPDLFLELVERVLSEHSEGTPAAPARPVEKETVYLAEYNRRLIQKLEKKMLDLEEVNRELTESEQKYRQLVENANDAVVVLTPTGCFSFVSPRFCEITGYTSEEANGLALSALIHPDDEAVVLETFERTMAGEDVPCAHGFRIVTKQAGTIRADCSASPIVREGRIIGVQAIIRDITDRWQVEQALEDSEQRYRALVQNVPVGLYRSEPEAPGRLVMANPALAGMFGYESVEELLEVPVADLYWDAADREAFSETLFAQGHAAAEELRLKKRDGSLLWGAVTSTVARGESGNVDHFDGLIEDITERKRAQEESGKLEEQLHRAQRLETIGTLAGGVAHDFNNLLTPILGYVELALLDLPPDSEVTSRLKHVILAANRAKALVQQILTFSRRTDEEHRPVDLSPIVKEALKLLQASLPSTIEIGSEIDPDCGIVMADPTQIHQILMNLCTNASYVMRESGGVLSVKLGSVQVDAEFARLHLNLHEGPYVRLEVSDTGPGMERATLERAFEPFFTTKLGGEGTGLGLSVVHGIVASHGGDISVYSEPGKGTAFHVYLPQVVAEEPVRSRGPDLARGGGERILVVDDEEEIASMLKRMLDHLGYDATAITDSTEALEEFRSRPDWFDLVITDLTMPKMVGTDLAKKLLLIRSDIPIILASGLTEAMSTSDAEALGIRVLMRKPVSLADLCVAVRRALDE